MKNATRLQWKQKAGSGRYHSGGQSTGLNVDADIKACNHNLRAMLQQKLVAFNATRDVAARQLNREREQEHMKHTPANARDNYDVKLAEKFV